MKFLRKASVYIVFLCFALALAGCAAENRELPVSQPTGDWTVKVSASGVEYLYSESTGEKIIQVFCYDKIGHLVELSLEDCAALKNQTPVVSDSLVCGKDALKSRTPKANRGGYGFTAEETFAALGAGEKISADYKGAVTITIHPGDELGFVVSSTSTSSAAVNGAVASGAGFVWNSCLPVLSDKELSVDVPEGEIGYLRFEPYLNVARGTVGDSSSAKGEGAAWGISPVMTASGGADGLLEIVIK